MVEGDAVAAGDRLGIGMIGDNRRDLHRKQAVPPAVEKVDQAVVKSGDHDQNPRLPVGPPDLQPHPLVMPRSSELSSDRRSDLLRRLALGLDDGP